MTDITKPLFSLGRVVATPGASGALEAAEQPAADLLRLHTRGDWGCVGDEDRRLNDGSVRDGSRLLSAYRLKTGVKVWVITEAVDDFGRRPATTVLLPEEY